MFVGSVPRSQIFLAVERDDATLRYAAAMFERGQVWRAPSMVERDGGQVARGGLRRPSGLAASKVVPDMCLVSRLRCGLCCVACGAARGGGGEGEKREEERRTPPHKSGESASVETRRDAARKGLQTGIEPRVSKVVSLTPVSSKHATGTRDAHARQADIPRTAATSGGIRHPRTAR